MKADFNAFSFHQNLKSCKVEKLLFCFNEAGSPDCQASRWKPFIWNKSWISSSCMRNLKNTLASLSRNNCINQFPNIPKQEAIFNSTYWNEKIYLIQILIQVWHGVSRFYFLWCVRFHTLAWMRKYEFFCIQKWKLRGVSEAFSPVHVSCWKQKMSPKVHASK